MVNSEPPDYTEDWMNYWGFRYNHRLRRKLTSIAENPTNYVLPVKSGDLNPPTEEYDWSIDIDCLRIYPDSVLSDARKGYIRFIQETDRLSEYEPSPANLSICFTDDSYTLRDHFYKTTRFTGVAANEISNLTVELSRSPEILSKPTLITFECPLGHQTTIPQPIYDDRMICICGDKDCSNSVFSVSQNTQSRDIVRFDGVFDDREISFVALSSIPLETDFEELSKSDSISTVGIMRNTIDSDNTLTRVFEALSLNIT